MSKERLQELRQMMIDDPPLSTLAISILEELLDEITHQAALIEELGKDKERLDWMFLNVSMYDDYGPFFNDDSRITNFRQAIDAALDRAREGDK